MKTYMRRVVTLAAVGVSLLAAIGVQAVTPTDEAVAQWKSEGVWEQKVAEWQQFKANGGCSPNENLPYNRARMKERLAAGVTAVDTVWVPVILVDFPDLTYDQASYVTPGGQTVVQRAVGTAGKFDTLLWSQGLNPTGSMTEFYWENSYGKIFMQGVVMGWYTMPHNYSYYVAGDDGLGSGGPLLAKDAINTADAAGNDFSVFADAQQ